MTQMQVEKLRFWVKEVPGIPDTFRLLLCENTASLYTGSGCRHSFTLENWTSLACCLA